MVGRVVSTKMQKSATIIVESKKTHPLYKKTFIRTKKFIVDDPFGVKVGDIVIVEKIRPISKMKHWGIVKVLGQDVVSIEEAVLQEKAEEAIAEVMPEESEQLTVDSEQSKTVSAEVEEKPKRAPRKKKEEVKE